MDSIHEANRIAWLNDCSSAFEKLKNAKSVEEKSAVAVDLAKLVHRL